jgi:hypothetical protein
LDFVSEKSKKSLVFGELILELSIVSGNDLHEELMINENIFLISSSNPWYGDICVYIHTFKCPSYASRDERHRICHQA